MRLLGTCSICGGNVTVPSFWHGVIPPTPTCMHCGAVPKRGVATIEMEPRSPFVPVQSEPRRPR